MKSGRVPHAVQKFNSHQSQVMMTSSSPTFENVNTYQTTTDNDPYTTKSGVTSLSNYSSRNQIGKIYSSELVDRRVFKNSNKLLKAQVEKNFLSSKQGQQ